MYMKWLLRHVLVNVRTFTFATDLLLRIILLLGGMANYHYTAVGHKILYNMTTVNTMSFVLCLRLVGTIERDAECDYGGVLSSDLILSNSADVTAFLFAFAFVNWADDCDGWVFLVPKVDLVWLLPPRSDRREFFSCWGCASSCSIALRLIEGEIDRRRSIDGEKGKKKKKKKRKRRKKKKRLSPRRPRLCVVASHAPSSPMGRLRAVADHASSSPA
ncbi:hypothetical protein BHE74_00011810 [Ensete ventricosum]|nr:hypothetical protein BHE74_00011810 [Ensete ventricosum]